MAGLFADLVERGIDDLVALVETGNDAEGNLELLQNRTGDRDLLSCAPPRCWRTGSCGVDVDAFATLRAVASLSAGAFVASVVLRWFV